MSNDEANEIQAADSQESSQGEQAASPSPETEVTSLPASSEADQSVQDVPSAEAGQPVKAKKRTSREDRNSGRDAAQKSGGGRSRGRKDNQQAEEKSEWQEKVIQIRRVTKVVKGGKKLSFRAVVAVGNGQGSVGLGVGKSNEVVGAIQKAVDSAKKNLIKVPFHKTTIPHPVKSKASGSIVVLRPASEGTGVIAGGSARSVLDLSGIGNILCKSLGSSSPLNSARATLKALSELRSFEDIASRRGKTVKEILF